MGLGPNWLVKLLAAGGVAVGGVVALSRAPSSPTPKGSPTAYSSSAEAKTATSPDSQLSQLLTQEHTLDTAISAAKIQLTDVLQTAQSKAAAEDQTLTQEQTALKSEAAQLASQEAQVQSEASQLAAQHSAAVTTPTVHATTGASASSEGSGGTDD